MTTQTNIGLKTLETTEEVLNEKIGLIFDKVFKVSTLTKQIIEKSNGKVTIALALKQINKKSNSIEIYSFKPKLVDVVLVEHLVTHNLICSLTDKTNDSYDFEKFIKTIFKTKHLIPVDSERYLQHIINRLDTKIIIFNRILIDNDYSYWLGNKK